jgi:hypothetical protein
MAADAMTPLPSRSNIRVAIAPASYGDRGDLPGIGTMDGRRIAPEHGFSMG